MSKLFKSVQMNEREKKVISHIYQAEETVKVANEENEIEQEIHKEQVNRIINDAQETANNILKQAKKQADELLSNEQQKIEDWWNKKREEDSFFVEEAKQNGFNDGYKQGLKQAMEEMEQKYRDKFLEAQQILESAYNYKEQIIIEAEEKILELSLAITEKIILKELELDPNIVKAITKETLKNIKEFEKVSINVHPNYFAYIQSAREELLMELSGQVELLIFPDPSIESGGCLVKTSYGTIDARIDTQLEEIKKLLFDVLGRRLND